MVSTKVTIFHMIYSFAKADEFQKWMTPLFLCPSITFYKKNNGILSIIFNFELWQLFVLKNVETFPKTTSVKPL